MKLCVGELVSGVDTGVAVGKVCSTVGSNTGLDIGWLVGGFVERRKDGIED
jgi:hypothetical protein